MSAMQQIAVLGLGRFGRAVAVELTRIGHDVLAIDASQRIVQDAADDVTHAVQADITDVDALRELGVGSFDTVIVASSGSLEVSILATVIVKQLGVKRIIAKAANALHGSILQQIGATRVVYPEHETGCRVAHSFAAPGVRDYLDVSPGYGIARVNLPEFMLGKSIGDIDLRKAYGLTLLALHRSGTVTLNPQRGETLRPGDELIVAGLDEDLQRLPGAGTVTQLPERRAS